MLKEKFKGLKISIKGWQKEEYGELEEKARKLVEEIVELDQKGEVLVLEDEEIQSRKSKFVELWQLLKARDVMFS